MRGGVNGSASPHTDLVAALTELFVCELHIDSWTSQPVSLYLDAIGSLCAIMQLTRHTSQVVTHRVDYACRDVKSAEHFVNRSSSSSFSVFQSACRWNAQRERVSRTQFSAHADTFPRHFPRTQLYLCLAARKYQDARAMDDAAIAPNNRNNGVEESFNTQ